MGWFAGESAHKKQVDAAFKVLFNLYEKSTDGGSDAPLVLSFSLVDSRLRYLMFCLSTVQAACAHHMKNPDAVLNELLHSVLSGGVTGYAQMFFGGHVEPQAAANQAAAYLQDYLARWSAYLDIREGGNSAAATGIVCSMLRSAESSAPAGEDDGPRLWPLARWIEERLGAMGQAFVNMAR